MAISPARVSAFDILLKIEIENGFSSDLLAQYADGLGERDRSLCHELTLGILRRQIHLDRTIALLTNGKQLDAAVTIALRMGLYQLLFLDRVPDYSATNESVELVARAKKTSAKGLVNAVLRRAARAPVEIKYTDQIDRISVETSHPRWLIERWTAEFGSEAAVGLAAANNAKPKVAFRTTFRFLESGSASDLDDLQGTYQRSSAAADCFITDQISPELRAAELRGEIYFQDEASQLVTQAVRLRPGDKFLDICAAPGSKATLIAAQYETLDPRPLFIAGDINQKRTQFLKDNCKKQGVGFVDCVRYDAGSSLPFADESFDAVLLDAPCTGTGTIRHNPEIRYRVTSEDIKRSAAKQITLLQNAARLPVPGGRLIYSTCSLEIEENESVIKSFLEDDDRFTVCRPELPERFLTPEGFARTFPSRDDMDGFFIAVLEKKAE